MEMPRVGERSNAGKRRSLSWQRRSEQSSLVQEAYQLASAATKEASDDLSVVPEGNDGVLPAWKIGRKVSEKTPNCWAQREQRGREWRRKKIGNLCTV